MCTTWPNAGSAASAKMMESLCIAVLMLHCARKVSRQPGKPRTRRKSMNATFTLLQGTGDGKELQVDLYKLAHGADGALHKDTNKVAMRIVIPSADDNPTKRKFTETILLRSEER